MLDNENQRLMRVQNELITDANRRVEVRFLHFINIFIYLSFKELRELCCFLDDDRQKTRRLAKEWQKFGRYTSQVMKQEMSMNQQRLRESEERHMEAIRENEELKQLCLYLDEQRQRFTNYRAEDDRESEDLGCGSSERSEDCDDSKYTCDIPGINPQKVCRYFLVFH
uniref:Coiled-coil domain-containing protein 58 n=1 Tax=Angiostrongylus cantonensis TaxID=6313 RepID=A0A0K0DBM8_ANGCA